MDLQNIIKCLLFMVFPNNCFCIQLLICYGLCFRRIYIYEMSQNSRLISFNKNLQYDMNNNEVEVRILVFFKILPILFIVLIVVIGFSRSCVNKKEDPMDYSINVSREIVAQINVVDSTYNGFRVAYATVNNVTKERLTEIRSRDSIKDAFCRLQKEAPLYFGSLLHTDIYDFGLFAKNYDICKDIAIHCIFVTGKEKVALYAQRNPNLKNSADWINPNVEQGVQWIKGSDIYYYIGKEHRTYRYWKCYSLYATSSIDERFSHFTENERIR